MSYFKYRKLLKMSTANRCWVLSGNILIWKCRLFTIVWHWECLIDHRLFPHDSVFLSPWKKEMEVCTCGWKPKGDRMKVNSGRKLREQRVGFLPCWIWHNHNSTATALQRTIVWECTLWLGWGSDRPVCEGQSFPHNTLQPLANIWPQLRQSSSCLCRN